ncbi:hypothetical protein CORMATOL_02471 [Corynebacterium matruchotii ATCC 33806]|uniref:Uncharacterized protein n=1 Tax=Corynebacterium matruchotii ATCC 33806 TaxID=566549 RepID=C0E638_9CORY|nr:hypothetical protein CORMATOL_02471 [Corynebacterium matruchotii ATCC 33806]
MRQKSDFYPVLPAISERCQAINSAIKMLLFYTPITPTGGRR